jgi:predicted amidohydrolase YtcJ
MPTAALEEERISDLMYHYSAMSSGRGSGDDMFGVDGIMLGNGNTDPEHIKLLAAEYPYEQWAGFFAQCLPPNDKFVQWAIEAARLGLRLSHMGDYANLEEDLNAFERIDREISIRDRRWVLMHVMTVTPGQLKRIKELGLIVEVLPTLMYMASDREGLDKLREKAIPIRELIDAGIPVVMGSDGTPNSMLWGLWMAIARWDEDSKSRLGESRLSREEALRVIQNGHMITWDEDRLGSLEAGKMADLIVLGENPLTCPEDQIKDIQVDLTIVGGKVVYERKAGQGE